MNVNHILRLKGSHAIETIAPHASLADAVTQLAEKRIGALVVTGAQGQIAGILSERDIVRTLGTQGAAALRQPVSSAMTARVETLAPTDQATSVLERMTHGRFRHMPVVDGGRMVGFLSIGDVVKARITEMEEENAQLAGMLSG